MCFHACNGLLTRVTRSAVVGFATLVRQFTRVPLVLGHDKVLCDNLLWLFSLDWEWNEYDREGKKSWISVLLEKRINCQ